MRIVQRWVMALLLGASMASVPAGAQVTPIDPDSAARADALPPPGERGYDAGLPVNPAPTPHPSHQTPPPPADPGPGVPPPAPSDTAATAPIATTSQPTWKRDDLIGAGERVFGKGAAGLAGMIERLLAEQGEPNAYIAGREISGAVGLGLRYGSGTLSHKVEGERAVYWTGPSIGFDVGGDAARVFVLVYNLFDTAELYRRYPQAEGRAYFVGGMSATYLRRGNVVLIPVRLGVGARLGANIGYMKFTEKSRWFPF